MAGSEPNAAAQSLEESEFDSQYSPEYLRDCASDPAREERLHELARRIALGAYRIDENWVADQMVQRGVFDGD